MMEWFFTQTIYGVAALAALLYALAFALKKAVPKAPDPFAVAAIGFVLLLATVPSYPRFKFERDVLAMLEQSPHMKVVATTRNGDLLEPITWFHAPTGFVHAVGPNSPIEGGYRRIILRYDEDPVVTFEDPDCENFTNWVSAPDPVGTVRYTTRTPEPLSQADRELFCEMDWTAEQEALMRSLTSGPHEHLGKRIMTYCSRSLPEKLS